MNWEGFWKEAAVANYKALLGLQIWKVAAILLNKQSRTADKE